MTLTKVPASGMGEPEQLALTGREAYWPAISRSGNRLAYQRRVTDSNIWRLALSGPGVASGPPTRVIFTTRLEWGAQYSPNGKRIVYESDRSGVNGIWVCDADGFNAQELYLQPGAGSGTARWSPNGQFVAFGSLAEANTDIYVIRAGGGNQFD